MKIGVLTYYGDLNFGTNMQALSTLKSVRDAYPDEQVEIIPIHTFIPRIVPYKTFSPISIWRDVIRIYKYHRFKKKYLGVIGHDPIIRNLDKAIEYIQSRGYERIYVGADTLLELDRLSTSYDGLSAYWLKDVKADKYVVAASCKSTQYEKLSEKQKEDMKIAISQFKGIAVRDRATFELFAHFVDKDMINVLADPTFNYGVDSSYTEAYLRRKGISIPKKSVMIQSASEDIWLDEVVKELKAAGYFIVTLRPIHWTDLSLNDMSPLEQSAIYRYVEFVITLRFHDCVYCLMNHTPVLSYARGGMSTSTGESKQMSVMKDFCLYPEGYLGSVDQGIQYDNILDRIEKVRKKFDPIQIDKKIKDYADNYKSYLLKGK